MTSDLTRRWIIMNDKEVSAVAAALAYFTDRHPDPALWDRETLDTIANVNRLLRKYYDGQPVGSHPSFHR